MYVFQCANYVLNISWFSKKQKNKTIFLLRCTFVGIDANAKFCLRGILMVDTSVCDVAFFRLLHRCWKGAEKDTYVKSETWFFNVRVPPRWDQWENKSGNCWNKPLLSHSVKCWKTKPPIWKLHSSYKHAGHQTFVIMQNLVIWRANVIIRSCVVVLFPRPLGLSGLSLANAAVKRSV